MPTQLPSHRSRTQAVCSFLLGGLLGLPLASTASPAAWKPTAGPHPVVTKALTLQDPARGKTLSFLVRHPSGLTGPVPVVLFSHGLGGNQDAFAELSTHLASHGYAVIHPTHGDSLRERRTRGESLQAPFESPERASAAINLRDRRADIVFLLDSFAEIEALAPGLRLDRTRIAMAGHSAGAMTTQVVTGVRFEVAGVARSFRDPRIRAGVLISGQGVVAESRALTKESWRDLSLPTLTLTGTEDYARRVSTQTPETRQHPYRYAPPGDKYLLVIAGATHSSYQGKDASRRSGDRPGVDVQKVASLTNTATLAFLDAYVRDDSGAKAYLQSEALRQLSGTGTTWEWK
jgi:predicted dienelactone hydrolase